MAFPAVIAGAVPLLRRHWKLGVGALLVLGAFGTGWKVNGWRYEAAEADRQAEIARVVAERTEALRAEYEALQRFSDRNAEMYESRITLLRRHSDELETELESATLSKPITCEKADADTPPGASNPFSADFVRLWNAGSLPE